VPNTFVANPEVAPPSVKEWTYGGLRQSLIHFRRSSGRGGTEAVPADSASVTGPSLTFDAINNKILHLVGSEWHLNSLAVASSTLKDNPVERLTVAIHAPVKHSDSRLRVTCLIYA
jgi:hypothetical protein